jgi:hypothetical protein
MRKFETVMFAAAVAGAALLVAAPAMAAFSAKVRKACSGDYETFCSQYPPDSTEVRRCFESNRKGLTYQCVTALVDAGEVPARYLKKK